VTATSTAEPFLPTGRSLRTLAKAAADCRGCELYQNASQTVFGAGLAKAKVVFVGEQPGDIEDRQGKPFVGPAGRILDRALAEAGIDRDAAYLTNAVKHFRWKSTSQGKRRIHDKDTQLIESMGESWNVVDLFEALHQSVDSASRRNQLRRRQPQREQAQGRPPAAPVGSRHDFGIRTHRGWSIRCLRFAIDG
jgi:hypothetical protein